MSTSKSDPASLVPGAVVFRADAPGNESPPIAVTDHTLIRRIGRGAYGEVWLARNALGSLRAVKIVMRGAFSDDRPFEREFQGIQRFEPISRRHETQLNILHVGRTESGFYYVMELADAVPEGGDTVEGAPPTLDPNQLTDVGAYVPHTLRSELRRRGRLPANECLQLGLALTAALDHLHQHGLVHRDIKPSNIVFIRGKPKLADIGLVSGVEDAKSFVGTDGYIPPEGPGTAQADLYSLGKVLYELATGKDRKDFPKLPDEFRGTAAGAAFADLNEILLRACATEPSQRYQSAERMRAELLLHQAGRSIRGLRASELLLRRLKLAGATGLSCLVVMAGFALYQRQRATERAAQVQALKEKEEQRRQIAYAADMAIAFQGWEAGRAELSRELLEAQRPGAEEDLRGWEWRYLWAQTRQAETQRMTTSSPFGLWSCAVAPDGLEAVGGTVDGQLVCWDPRSGKTLAVLGPAGGNNPVDTIAFSPDGSLIYQSLRDSGEIVIWNRASRKELRRFRTGQVGMKLALSRDGTRLAAVSGPDYAPGGTGELVLLDSHRGDILARSATQSTWLVRVVFSPNGQFIATCGGRGQAKVWSTPDLREVAVLPHDAQSTLFALAFSPDGMQLATGGSDGLLRTWQWETRHLQATWMGHAFGCDALQWSPDGAWLASGGRDQIVRIWQASNQAKLAELKGHHGRVTGLAFSSDGRTLLSASTDKSLRSWALANLVPARQTNGWSGVSFESEISLDPNGQWLAFVAESNQVVVVSLPSLQPQIRVEGRHPTFAPDGQSLVTVVSNQLKMYSIPGGTPLRTFISPDELTGNAAFSPQGEVVAARTTTGGYVVWGTETAEPVLRKAENRSLRGLFLIQGGKELMLLHAADGMLEGIDVATGCGTRRLVTGDGSATCAAFSPDETALLIGETAARMRLVNLKTGQVELLRADAGSVTSVGWSADGQTMAACTFEGFIKLWNVRTRREMATLRGHSSIVKAVHFSRDGRYLASASYDRTWRLWTAPDLTETGPGFSSTSPGRR